MLHAKTIEGWLFLIKCINCHVQFGIWKFWTNFQLHRHIRKQIWLPCTNSTMVYSFHPIQATLHKRTWFDLRALDKKNWYVIRRANWCALSQWWINYLTRMIAPINVFKKKSCTFFTRNTYTIPIEWSRNKNHLALILTINV